ncbi:hypothetical protein D3C72_1103120 [compost metagenome]
MLTDPDPSADGGTTTGSVGVSISGRVGPATVRVTVAAVEVPPSPVAVQVKLSEPE